MHLFDSLLLSPLVKLVATNNSEISLAVTLVSHPVVQFQLFQI